MPDHFYVYPAYLLKSRSRAAGRRVKAEESVGELTAEEIVMAARRLGYTAVAEADKDYPRDAGSFGGRVKVSKRAGTSKARFLKLLSTELRTRRPSGGPH
jgi:signal recognition particle subunit SEC65